MPSAHCSPVLLPQASTCWTRCKCLPATAAGAASLAGGAAAGVWRCTWHVPWLTCTLLASCTWTVRDSRPKWRRPAARISCCALYLLHRCAFQTAGKPRFPHLIYILFVSVPGCSEEQQRAADGTGRRKAVRCGPFARPGEHEPVHNRLHRHFRLVRLPTPTWRMRFPSACQLTACATSRQ